MPAWPDVTRNAPLSTLITTYAGERPDRLRMALESLINQTLPAAETVLVVDGPVGDAQESVVAGFESQPGFVIVRCPVRRGIARALNQGLVHCRQPFVARMDSDDISAAHRFETQMARLSANPRLDLVASWHREFADDPDVLRATKRSPADHEQIARALRWRNVLSHPTIVVRRSLLELVGGYREMRYLEDYDLYLRLLKAGARFEAIQEPLVLVRTTPDQVRRRGGMEHVRAEWKFRFAHFRTGSLGAGAFVSTGVAYTAFRMLPNAVRQPLYRLVRAQTEGSQ